MYNFFHLKLGESRAATIACAYLMLKKNYSATQVELWMLTKMGFLRIINIENTHILFMVPKQNKKGAPILHTCPSTLSKALQYMRNTREVQPNFGFLQQLAEMDNGLRKERYRQSGFRG